MGVRISTGVGPVRVSSGGSGCGVFILATVGVGLLSWLIVLIGAYPWISAAVLAVGLGVVGLLLVRRYRARRRQPPAARR